MGMKQNRIAAVVLHSLRRAVCWLAICCLTACSTAPPQNIHNVCEMYDEYYDWYLASENVHKRWGVPPHVTMAFIHQESKFVGDARPPWEWFMWIIPLGRSSSAFGYAQALDGTWEEYQVKSENWGADRDDFEDAVDFIGWYNHKTLKRNRVNPNDAYSLYLAYHEGQGGFARGTYKNKGWLLKVARKVAKLAKSYERQLRSCRAELEDGRFWRSIFG